MKKNTTLSEKLERLQNEIRRLQSELDAANSSKRIESDKNIETNEIIEKD